MPLPQVRKRATGSAAPVLKGTATPSVAPPVDPPTVVVPVLHAVPPLPAEQVTDLGVNEPLRLVDQVNLKLAPRRIPEGRVDDALRILRRVMGRRPPLLLPVSDNARAAATAAVCELRARTHAIAGETEMDRPVMEVSSHVLDAAAPFIQRDLVNRVLADRLIMLSTIGVGAAASAVALVCALVYGLTVGAVWLSTVAGIGLLVSGFASYQLASAVGRQTQRAREVSAQPMTGVDQAEETIDLTAARAETINLRDVQ